MYGAVAVYEIGESVTRKVMRLQPVYNQFTYLVTEAVHDDSQCIAR